MCHKMSKSKGHLICWNSCYDALIDFKVCVIFILQICMNISKKLCFC